MAESYAARHPGTQPGRYVCFSVTDSGGGMDGATMARIFDPFFTTKDQGKGTGLGLSTVWGIVTQSGGSVSVSSEPGRGSRFEVLLPAVDELPSPSQTNAKPPRPAAGDETILIVEDEEQVRKLMCSVLRRAGYRILEATNGVEGLSVSQRHEGRIHLLLTDVIMPQMNGREMARALVSQRPDTKVLYLSGYTANAMSTHDACDEDVVLLAKPIAPQQLLQEVRVALDRR